MGERESERNWDRVAWRGRGLTETDVNALVERGHFDDADRGKIMRARHVGASAGDRKAGGREIRIDEYRAAGAFAPRRIGGEPRARGAHDQAVGRHLNPSILRVRAKLDFASPGVSEREAGGQGMIEWAGASVRQVQVARDEVVVEHRRPVEEIIDDAPLKTEGHLVQVNQGEIRQTRRHEIRWQRFHAQRIDRVPAIECSTARRQATALSGV